MAMSLQRLSARSKHYQSQDAGLYQRLAVLKASWPHNPMGVLTIQWERQASQELTPFK